MKGRGVYVGRWGSMDWQWVSVAWIYGFQYREIEDRVWLAWGLRVGGVIRDLVVDLGTGIGLIQFRVSGF